MLERMINLKKIQLVAPAGNMKKLSASIKYGADTVFLGGKLLNISAGMESFGDEELKEAVAYAKERGKRVQVLLNAVPHNEEIESLPDYLKFLESIKIDEVLVSDLGVFQCVKEFTNLDIVVSTHSSNTNWLSVQMWKKMGAKKVVLDREISLDGVVQIKKMVPDIELEVFVHGPILLAISGRKILENYLEGHTLEKRYHERFSLVEETRPGENMPLFQDRYGTYIYGARELCVIESIEALLTLGIDSIRIEGGMKGITYLEKTVSVYREILDSFNTGKFFLKEEWSERLKQTTKLPFINWYKSSVEEVKG